MAFGRRKEVEPPVAPAHWRDAQRFVTGSVERPPTPGRKKPVLGPWAVRIAQGTGEELAFAPCAYRPPASAPLPPGLSGQRLYEDEAGLRLLCHLDEGTAQGRVKRHEVRGTEGELIGVIVRHPPRNPLVRHTWRLEQPGHPEIVGRNEWARPGAGTLADEALSGFLTNTEKAALLPTNAASRVLRWRTGDETVMHSRGDECTIRADWLDRRLAFAYALLGDR